MTHFFFSSTPIPIIDKKQMLGKAPQVLDKAPQLLGDAGCKPSINFGTMRTGVQGLPCSNKTERQIPQNLNSRSKENHKWLITITVARLAAHEIAIKPSTNAPVVAIKAAGTGTAMAAGQDTHPARAVRGVAGIAKRVISRAN